MISGRRIELIFLESEAVDVFSWRLGAQLESAVRPLLADSRPFSRAHIEDNGS